MFVFVSDCYCCIALRCLFLLFSSICVQWKFYCMKLIVRFFDHILIRFLLTKSKYHHIKSRSANISHRNGEINSQKKVWNQYRLLLYLFWSLILKKRLHKISKEFFALIFFCIRVAIAIVSITAVHIDEDSPLDRRVSHFHGIEWIKNWQCI